MKHIISGLLLCLIINTIKGQTYKELKIGDTLPAINLSYLNGRSVEIRPLASFYKNNFLIIDFWANWCGACISAMAAADSVSKKFNGVLKILPITYQDAETVGNFVQKNEILKKLGLDYVVNDSVLMGGYFKFNILPHEIWIDTQGIVKAITYADQITFEKVSQFIKAKPLMLSEKVDDMNFSIDKPLTIENNLILYRAILAPYKPGLSNMIGTLSEAYQENIKEDRFFALNKDILSMFYAAYSQSNGTIDYNRIDLLVQDSLGLSPFLKQMNVPRQVIMKYTYCYELILPHKILKNSFYSYLLQDLNRLFSYKASIEKRKRECWVLINNNKFKNPTSIGISPKLIWEKGFIKKMYSQKMITLVSYLNWNMDLPVINETHFTNVFDINLDLDAVSKDGKVFLDIEKVKKSLRVYGFDIVKKVRYVDILVIREEK